MANHAELNINQFFEAADNLCLVAEFFERMQVEDKKSCQKFTDELKAQIAKHLPEIDLNGLLLDDGVERRSNLSLRTSSLTGKGRREGVKAKTDSDRSAKEPRQNHQYS